MDDRSGTNATAISLDIDPAIISPIGDGFDRSMSLQVEIASFQKNSKNRMDELVRPAVLESDNWIDQSRQ